MSMYKKIIKICAVAAIIYSVWVGISSSAPDTEKPRLTIFFTPTCYACIKVEREIIPQIKKMYGDRIIAESHNIDDIESYRLLLRLEKKHGIGLTGSLPVFYMGGRFINGYAEIKNRWQRFIDDGMASGGAQEPDVLPAVDLTSRFRGFTPALIIGAGLVDGVNPCAFTVIVFFMSFMALQGYKKRELVTIGLCFISAIFITYILIGLGVFGFFYRFAHIWLVVRIINYSIGIFCVLLGIISVYDFFKYKKTGDTEGLLLQLPKGIKVLIRRVIGLFGRMADEHDNGLSGERTMHKIIINALLTGFIVSLLEAVCTGQAYIPTISFILKTTPLKMQAIGYLALYNFMFIVPLMLIFTFSVFGVTSDMFSRILKKNLLLIKALMAAMFFGFGIFLIYKA